MGQKFFMDSPLRVSHLVNDHLAAGWRIVAGSVGVGSVEYVPNRRYVTQDEITPANTMFKELAWAVVEKEEP